MIAPAVSWGTIAHSGIPSGSSFIVLSLPLVVYSRARGWRRMGRSDSSLSWRLFFDSYPDLGVVRVVARPLIGLLSLVIVSNQHHRDVPETCCRAPANALTFSRSVPCMREIESITTNPYVPVRSSSITSPRDLVSTMSMFSARTALFRSRSVIPPPSLGCSALTYNRRFPRRASWELSRCRTGVPA